MDARDLKVNLGAFQICNVAFIVGALNDTGITTICLSIFRLTPGFKKLDLSFNRIFSLFGTVIQFLADIVENIFSHNETSLTSNSNFTKMKNMNLLDLSLNQNTYFKIGLPQSLSYLNLSSNVINELSDTFNHHGL